MGRKRQSSESSAGETILGRAYLRPCSRNFPLSFGRVGIDEFVVVYTRDKPCKRDEGMAHNFTGSTPQLFFAHRGEWSLGMRLLLYWQGHSNLFLISPISQEPCGRAFC